MELEAYQLSYQVKEKVLIQEINATFYSGQIYGILGPNGAGKSTLLKVLSGIWKPSHGEVYWQGKNLFQLSRSDTSRIISLVPQNPLIHFDFTAYEMVAMGRYPHGPILSHDKIIIENALKTADVWLLKDRLLSQLSGGERQRVYIARALATEAAILLLDEPTSYLDLRHQLELWKLLRQLTEQGKMIIVAVHDLLVSKRHCDQILVLNEGKSVGKGDYETVMTPSLLHHVFGVKLEDYSDPKSFNLV